MSSEPTPPVVPDYEEPCPFDARQIGIRALILQGLFVIACEVEPGPVFDWFRENGIWDYFSPKEQAFLLDPHAHSEHERKHIQWFQEAEWTLLWAISKLEELGLPTRECDTRRLVDEIIPGLGDDVKSFLNSAKLRSPGVLLAEDDRHYNLWWKYHQAMKAGPEFLPIDLHPTVLYYRQYAFEWLHGIQEWDDVSCDTCPVSALCAGPNPTWSRIVVKRL